MPFGEIYQYYTEILGVLGGKSCFGEWGFCIVPPKSLSIIAKNIKGYVMIFKIIEWGGRWESNPRPSGPQSDALTAFSTAVTEVPFSLHTALKVS